MISTALALSLAATACNAPAAAPEAGLERSPAGLDQVPLTVRSDGEAHRFIVEVARTPEQQARGLMYRESIAPDRGMIFLYEPSQNISFWMKNTLIPLDIIFIRADGSIARIAENTTPLSLQPIPSLEPVSAVLELAGGRSAELGLKPGDRVEWGVAP